MNHPNVTWLPTSERVFIGVDGCKGGWIVATIVGDQLQFSLQPNLVALLENNSARVLIDMPIGLPGHQRRACDLEARTVLGHRRSTLFPVAARNALYASTYLECCEVNARLQGCRVSKQLWNLSPKIRHLDELLQARMHLNEHVAEGHPEVAFARLSRHGIPLLPKATPAGREQRIAVIDRILAGNARDTIDRFISLHSRYATAVDCLDAAGLALLLFKGQGGMSFFGDGALDEVGIPMRIASAPLLYGRS